MDVIIVAVSVVSFAIAIILWQMTKQRVCSLEVHAPVALIRDRGRMPHPHRGGHGRRDPMLFDTRRGIPYAHEFRFDVRLTFPVRVYEGDSHNIDLDFFPNASSPDTTRRMRQCPEELQKDGSLIWVIPVDPDVAQFVQATLAAAGFNVDGERVQRQDLVLENLSFNWNCYFPNSGTHTFGLHTHATVLDGIRKVGSLERTIKVVRIRFFTKFLTKRQVWIIEQIAVIVGAAFAIGVTLHKLGLW